MKFKLHIEYLGKKFSIETEALHAMEAVEDSQVIPKLLAINPVNDQTPERPSGSDTGFLATKMLDLLKQTLKSSGRNVEVEVHRINLADLLGNKRQAGVHPVNREAINKLGNLYENAKDIIHQSFSTVNISGSQRLLEVLTDMRYLAATALKTADPQTLTDLEETNKLTKEV